MYGRTAQALASLASRPARLAPFQPFGRVPLPTLPIWGNFAAFGLGECQPIPRVPPVPGTAKRAHLHQVLQVPRCGGA